MNYQELLDNYQGFNNNDLFIIQTKDREKYTDIALQASYDVLVQREASYIDKINIELEKIEFEKNDPNRYLNGNLLENIAVLSENEKKFIEEDSLENLVKKNKNLPKEKILEDFIKILGLLKEKDGFGNERSFYSKNKFMAYSDKIQEYNLEIPANLKGIYDIYLDIIAKKIINKIIIKIIIGIALIIIGVLGIIKSRIGYIPFISIIIIGILNLSKALSIFKNKKQ